MFSRDIEQTKEFIKNWFENKFNLEVEYVNTFKSPNF
jgi:ribosomal protein L23